MPRRDHVARVYSQDSRLAVEVARFVAGALEEGDSAILVATPEHFVGVKECLLASGTDVDAAIAGGRLLAADAAETLARLTERGLPDADAFEAIVPPLVEKARSAAVGGRVRAFGEMVNLLWERGEFESAYRLETMWNGLLHRESFTLLCAYRMGLFDATLPASALGQMVETHGELLTDEDAHWHARIFDQAVDEVLGPGRAAMVRMVASPRPDVVRMVAWLRSNMPRLSGEVLVRARELAAST